MVEKPPANQGKWFENKFAIHFVFVPLTTAGATFSIMKRILSSENKNVIKYIFVS